MIRTTQKFEIRDCLEGMKELDDGSVDFVFTDPPYGKEFVYMYSEIAKEFKRLLKPGGFAFIYASDYWFPETFNSCLEHLDFFYLFHIILSGDNARIHPKQLFIGAKTLMGFSNGTANKHSYCSNTLYSKRDKGLHPWQQSATSAFDMITSFSEEGDLVLDPFLGSGTTARAARIANRNFIGYEIDENYKSVIRNYALVDVPKMTEY